MKAFRVSFVQFQRGDELPTGHKPADLTADRQEVESVLESMRPRGKPQRTNARYVFKDRDSALSWAKGAVGRRVYEVEVENVLHEGDWTWVGRIWKEGDAEARKRMAEKYWKSELSEQPTVELIVSKATVAKEDETITRSEQIGTVRAKFGMPDPDELFGKNNHNT